MYTNYSMQTDCPLSSVCSLQRHTSLCREGPRVFWWFCARGWQATLGWIFKYSPPFSPQICQWVERPLLKCLDLKKKKKKSLDSQNETLKLCRCHIWLILDSNQLPDRDWKLPERSGCWTCHKWGDIQVLLLEHISVDFRQPKLPIPEKLPSCSWMEFRPRVQQQSSNCGLIQDIHLMIAISYSFLSPLPWILATARSGW